MSYFSTLHRQSPEHKKRFALFVSGLVTIFIFGVWSLVTFGSNRGTVAQNEDDNTNEVSPIASFNSNIAGSLQALKNSFGELKATLNFYGQ